MGSPRVAWRLLATGATVPGGQFCFNHDFFDEGIHTVKFGINYQFWGPGFLSNTPILAGY